MKTQLAVEQKSGKIIAVATDMGRTHDFKLYKETINYKIIDKIKFCGDSGYQGICEYHANSETPHKKPKNGELTAEQKCDNKEISKRRIKIENVNAKLKVFKILANKYRNRRKRFNLRVNLICGIINFELGL
jgi:hypothetical protein